MIHDSYLEGHSIAASQSGEAHHVTQFCIENWGPSGKCANGDTVLEVVDEVGKVQRRTGNNPIVVHCR